MDYIVCVRVCIKWDCDILGKDSAAPRGLINIRQVGSDKLAAWMWVMNI